MKSIVFVIAVLGVAAFSSAQTQAPTIGLSASVVASDDKVIRMKNVEFSFGTVRITADEAEATKLSMDFELRGNVHMRVNAPK